MANSDAEALSPVAVFIPEFACSVPNPLQMSSTINAESFGCICGGTGVEGESLRIRSRIFCDRVTSEWIGNTNTPTSRVGKGRCHGLVRLPDTGLLSAAFSTHMEFVGYSV